MVLIVLEAVVVLLEVHPVIVPAVIFVRVSVVMDVVAVVDHVHMIAQVAAIAVVKETAMVAVVNVAETVPVHAQGRALIIAKIHVQAPV